MKPIALLWPFDGSTPKCLLSLKRSRSKMIYKESQEYLLKQRLMKKCPVEFSPQRRRGRRVDIFCSAARGRQTKSALSLQDKAHIMCHSRRYSPILFQKACLLQVGMEFLFQSSSPDWNRRNPSRRSPRLCGETWP